MVFDIRPYDGLGPFKLGFSQDEIHTLFGAPSASFLKAGVALTDEYDELGLFVYYDSEKKSEAYEAFPPARPAFQGKEILGESFREIFDWVRLMDPQLEVARSGFSSLLFGFGVYAPGALKEPQCPIEGMIVFRTGYYD